MSKNLFIPHGEFRFEWFGEVLYVKWDGTFNYEAMCAYVAEHKDQVNRANLPRWGRIVDLRKWEGITPDATGLFNELSDWLKTTHCIAQVQVFSDRFFQTIAAKVASNVVPSNLHQVFTIDEAVTVLGGHGLTADSRIADLPKN
ncbi:MAG: hypothetical protein IPH08_12695 [Rhodocyclaceae bacterium]|nr:hypothetical protein [Rhodocyclaceae bacterium]